MNRTYHCLKFSNGEKFEFSHEGIPGNWIVIRNNVMRQFHSNTTPFECPIFELPDNETIQFSMTQLSQLTSWEIKRTRI